MSEFQTIASVEQNGGAAHDEPTAFGLGAPVFISLAMLAVIIILVWKKVPGAIGQALDAKIALIRDQLSEAETLRTEAEALKAEYQAKAKSADVDREALLERARHEADEIVAKAKADAEALIERRGRMAEDKIAAAERAALDAVRAKAASAAAAAAEALIRDKLDAEADKPMVNAAIAELGKGR